MMVMKKRRIRKHKKRKRNRKRNVKKIRLKVQMESVSVFKGFRREQTESANKFNAIQISISILIYKSVNKLIALKDLEFK